MHDLIDSIKACTLCAAYLPNAPRPIFSISSTCKILIIGQAPGQKAHDSQKPWNDLSGIELRRWLSVTEQQFYNPELFGLMPMGFCFPGKSTSGDLPPRTECAPHWHHQILEQMNTVQLTLLIGKYAQQYYLGSQFNKSLTENVKNYKRFLPKYLPLVHPSPKNKLWQKKNPWFELEVVPALRAVVGDVLK